MGQTPVRRAESEEIITAKVIKMKCAACGSSVVITTVTCQQPVTQTIFTDVGFKGLWFRIQGLPEEKSDTKEVGFNTNAHSLHARWILNATSTLKINQLVTSSS